MAAPADKTIKNLNGQWVMNKSKSKDFDPVLQLQGIGWLTRTVISKATITVKIHQYTDEEGRDHLDVDQELSGGITSTPERRIFDWEQREHLDSTFGDLVGRTQYIDSKNLPEGYGDKDVEFLSAGWDSEEQIQSWVSNAKSGWQATQIWGFQVVDGERRYVRKAAVRKGDTSKTAFLVYDYKGPV